jgi:hypothetical protein
VAEGGEVAFDGGSAVDPGLVVVDVAFSGGHAASGEGTGAGFGFDEPFQGLVGSPFGGPVGDDLSLFIGDRVLVLGGGLLFG